MRALDRQKCLYGGPRAICDCAAAIAHPCCLRRFEMACEEWLFAPYDLKYRHEHSSGYNDRTRTGRMLHHSDALNVLKKA